MLTVAEISKVAYHELFQNQHANDNNSELLNMSKVIAWVKSSFKS